MNISRLFFTLPSSCSASCYSSSDSFSSGSCCNVFRSCSSPRSCSPSDSAPLLNFAPLFSLLPLPLVLLLWRLLLLPLLDSAPLMTPCSSSGCCTPSSDFLLCPFLAAALPTLPPAPLHLVYHHLDALAPPLILDLAYSSSPSESYSSRSSSSGPHLFLFWSLRQFCTFLWILHLLFCIQHLLIILLLLPPLPPVPALPLPM